MRIGYMAGLKEITLGGCNAIGLRFGRNEYYFALVVK